MSERIVCVYSDESTHGVSSIECSLGATQDINPFNVYKVEVEGRFVNVWDIVHIESYGRSVDARADTTDIYGRSQA